MIRISVVYPNIADSKFDFDYYVSTHMPLVAKLYGEFGLQSWQTDKGISMSSKVPADFLVACYLCFDTMDNVKLALKTNGAQVMADVANFTDLEPGVSFAQIEASS
jgi:uncharacterized protein (TIGR02118 family)